MSIIYSMISFHFIFHHVSQMTQYRLPIVATSVHFNKENNNNNNKEE